MLDTRPTKSHAPETRLLTTEEWKERVEAHLERVQRWTLPYKARRSRQGKHPVHDFLFQYYAYSPGKLETWHPAPDERLEDSPAARDRFESPLYQLEGGTIRRHRDGLTVRDRERLASARDVLIATRTRPPNFGCFGVHEWAMVYGGDDVRHEGVAALRLPQSEVDEFVDSRPVACSHFDAYRFFSPEAKPLNRIPLEWSTRHEMEQPGCIHANMDLYRWAYTAMPWVGSAILLECFELAVDLRALDMRASPYDLRDLGYEPIRVETPEGRAEYQSLQRAFSERASRLRDELIETIDRVLRD